MLSIQTERADGRESPAVRIIVQDNGEEVPADRLSRIFEPFFTTKSQGTGLGLSIAKKVVEGHGPARILTCALMALGEGNKEHIEISHLPSCIGITTKRMLVPPWKQ